MIAVRTTGEHFRTRIAINSSGVGRIYLDSRLEERHRQDGHVRAVRVELLDNSGAITVPTGGSRSRGRREHCQATEGANQLTDHFCLRENRA
jgi:hypothetical protein